MRVCICDFSSLISSSLLRSSTGWLRFAYLKFTTKTKTVINKAREVMAILLYNFYFCWQALNKVCEWQRKVQQTQMTVSNAWTLLIATLSWLQLTCVIAIELARGIKSGLYSMLGAMMLIRWASTNIFLMWHVNTTFHLLSKFYLYRKKSVM